MCDYVWDSYLYAEFHHDTINLFHPQIWKKAHQVTSLVFWFFCQPTAKTPESIFTISTSNDVVSRKRLPFGVAKRKKCYISNPLSPKKQILANF